MRPRPRLLLGAGPSSVRGLALGVPAGCPPTCCPGPPHSPGRRQGQAQEPPPRQDLAPSPQGWPPSAWSQVPCVPEDAGLPKFQLHGIPEAGWAGGGEGIREWAGAGPSRSSQAPGRSCAEVGDPLGPQNPTPALPRAAGFGEGKALGGAAMVQTTFGRPPGGRGRLPRRVGCPGPWGGPHWTLLCLGSWTGEVGMGGACWLLGRASSRTPGPRLVQQQEGWRSASGVCWNRVDGAESRARPALPGQ